MPNCVRAGIIGCGSFSEFIFEACMNSPLIEIAAIADISVERLNHAKTKFRVNKAYTDYRHLLDEPIDLVCVATPPFTHYQIAKEAIESSKHLFCEKPASLNLQDIESLIDMAAARGLKATVDFVMRRNPFYVALKQIIQSNTLGGVERAYFENFAHDDSLPSHHWFWDKHKSGGIWVEHSVHFFDLASWLLGEPLHVWASNFRRGLPPSLPGASNGSVVAADDCQSSWETPKEDKITPLEDRAISVVTYRNSTIASFYHGFTRPERFERNVFSFGFERGFVETIDWIPTRMTLSALVLKEDLPQLENLIPGCKPTVRILDEYHGAARQFMGKGKLYAADLKITLTYDFGISKHDMYRNCVKAGLEDIALSILNPDHQLTVTLENARSALQVALACEMSNLLGKAVAIC